MILYVETSRKRELLVRVLHSAVPRQIYFGPATGLLSAINIALGNGNELQQFADLRRAGYRRVYKHQGKSTFPSQQENFSHRNFKIAIDKR